MRVSFGQLPSISAVKPGKTIVDKKKGIEYQILSEPVKQHAGKNGIQYFFDGREEQTTFWEVKVKVPPTHPWPYGEAESTLTISPNDLEGSPTPTNRLALLA